MNPKGNTEKSILFTDIIEQSPVHSSDRTESQPLPHRRDLSIVTASVDLVEPLPPEGNLLSVTAFTDFVAARFSTVRNVASLNVNKKHESFCHASSDTECKEENSTPISGPATGDEHQKEISTSVSGYMPSHADSELFTPVSDQSNVPTGSDLYIAQQKVVENKENETSGTSVDPFDLNTDSDNSQETCQSFKRKFSLEIKSQKNHQQNVSVKDCGACPDNKETLPDDVINLDETGMPESKQRKTSPHVVYMHSEELMMQVNALSKIEGRAELVHKLISSYGLLRYIQVVAARPATDEEILGFHCPDYISFLHEASKTCEENSESLSKDAESFGLCYDCPVQKDVFKTASLISGASIAAAEMLNTNKADVAINWYGGWHHAKRDSASGFCYINDIVLGILKLREKFQKILYIDLDLHHGDGVEEAFEMTPSVMTVSFHKYSTGFFPGSGSVENVGTGHGKFYSVNVPLQDGIKDALFFAVYSRVLEMVKTKFQPRAVVVQCGADGLSEDPMASFNLTHQGLGRCVWYVLAWELPTLLLGGGGYNFPNTAKCWTFLTALAAGKKLPRDIPEHEHLLSYGPDYELNTTAGNRRDSNTRQDMQKVMTKIASHLSNI